MTQSKCPKCGHELVFKFGLYGQFIGCSKFPVCTYTANEDGSPTKRQRRATEWDEKGKPTSYGYEVLPQKKIKRKCPLEICDGSGLLPFTGKDGKVRKDVHLFCTCSPYHTENARNDCYSPLCPEDIDYPVSYSHWRSLCQYHGWQDPGSDYPPEPQEEAPKPQEIIHRHSDMSSKDFASLRSLEGQVKYLQATVEEIKARRKPQPKVKTITTGKPAFRGTV